MSSVRRVREESGSALIAGIIILMVVMMLGAVALQYANVQNHQTGAERAREAAFNLAESALQAENSALWQSWPYTAATAYPVCTQSSTTSSTCPQSAITEGFNKTYAGTVYTSPTWSVQLIDDNVTGVADTNDYSDAILQNASLAHWDSNGDNKLWIRASATVAGTTRTVVAMSTRQSYVVDLPQNVLTAGAAATSNNGSKIMIEAKDPNSGLTGAVDLRCNTNSTPSNGNSCAAWDARHGQLDPASAYQVNYTDPIVPYQTLSNGEIEALRQSAQYGGTYYSTGTCPTQGTTGVLFIENANCSYSSGTWGSDTNPVALVVYNGTLTFNGVIVYGVVYMVDSQGSVPASGPCTTSQQNQILTLQGLTLIHGGMFVDHCGVAMVGDAGPDVQYDTAVFSALRTYSPPALALSTFRVIANNGS